MEICKLWQQKNYSNQTATKSHLEYRKFTSQLGFAFLEAIIALSILSSLLVVTLKINSRFDKFEKKSIEKFKNKWDKLEQDYGKN